MRTTLTLDDDVARLISDAAHRERRTTKDVVNDALRRALRDSRPRAYTVDVHESRVRSGVDVGRLNDLADEVADDEFLALEHP